MKGDGNILKVFVVDGIVLVKIINVVEGDSDNDVVNYK